MVLSRKKLHTSPFLFYIFHFLQSVIVHVINIVVRVIITINNQLKITNFFTFVCILQ